ncbi:uncharacterized protein [Spinacia oleracea]|uniref:RNase H type-1 domain-containing protein n=1 Tax=Spinacia oleracea TaxID=3562 RepID=A0ABM3R7R1_SPIOL|nr:uncharacterized protein LOC130467236 [Spinacia oleracea]
MPTSCCPRCNLASESITFEECRCFFKGANAYKEWDLMLQMDSHQLKAAASIIIRDTKGDMVLAKAFNLGDTWVSMAEALALHKGVQEAIRLGLQNLQIEGDNLLVINALKGIWNVPWKLQNIFQDIKTLLHSLHNVHIQHVFRDANRGADWIANVGHLII